MTTGWLSVGIGTISILIGTSGYVLGRVVGSLLSDLDTHTREAMYDTGAWLVLIMLPRRFATTFFRWRDRAGSVQYDAVTATLVLLLMLPFARIVTATSDRGSVPGKGEEVVFLSDARNLSSALSGLTSSGSFLSLLLGVVSIVFGIFSLVAPSARDGWTTTGWLSVGIGTAAIVVGTSGYVLGRLVDSLLSDVKTGRRDATKARSFRLVTISLPRFYGWVVLSIFRWGDSPRVIRQHALTQFMFWSLLLPFARASTERSDTGKRPGKGNRVELIGDAGHVSTALSALVSFGSFFSLLFGLLSVTFGILSLVAPWIIDDWIPNTASLIRENRPWLGWLVLILLIGAVVLLTWLVTGRRQTWVTAMRPSRLSSSAADPPRPWSNRKSLSLAEASIIHIEAHILGSFGQFLLKMGRYGLAIRYLDQALKGHQKVREPEGKAANLNDLGVAFYYRGELDVALDRYRQALEIFEAVHDERGSAGCLANMATVYLDRRDRAKAVNHYRRALIIYERLGMHKAADRLRHVISGVGGRRQTGTP